MMNKLVREIRAVNSTNLTDLDKVYEVIPSIYIYIRTNVGSGKLGWRNVTLSARDMNSEHVWIIIWEWVYHLVSRKDFRLVESGFDVRFMTSGGKLILNEKSIRWNAFSYKYYTRISFLLEKFSHLTLIAGGY